MLEWQVLCRRSTAKLQWISIIEIHQVRSLFQHYALKDLCARTTFQTVMVGHTDTNWKNHIYVAKWAMWLSCLEQENIKLKLETGRQYWSRKYFNLTFWKRGTSVRKTHAQLLPATPSEQTSGSKDGIDGNLPIMDGSQYKQTLLWVHQAEWQKQPLSWYGNTINLIDANNPIQTCPVFHLCAHECWIFMQW